MTLAPKLIDLVLGHVAILSIPATSEAMSKIGIYTLLVSSKAVNISTGIILILYSS